MEILFLQYSIAVIVCLYTINPSRKIYIVRHKGLPLQVILGIFLLTFLSLYSILDKAMLNTNAGSLNKAFFIGINLLLFAVVPAGFVFLKIQFHNRKIMRKDLVHLTPALIYIICFIYPYVAHQDYSLSPDKRSWLLFRVFSYGIVSLYILLVIGLLFYRYSPLIVFNNEFNKGLQPAEKQNIQIVHTDQKTISIGSVHLSEDQLEKMDEKLKSYFLSGQPFLKRGYSLKQLSEDTEFPLHHLSAFINKYYQLNFNDFVNEYRVQYCQDKIRKDEWKLKTLQAIAEESGFNNRNTFTSAFKKVTGRLPSDYLRMIKEKQPA